MPFGPYDAGGTRTVEAERDVRDAITRIAREETPIVSALGRKPTSQIKVEWLTDSLAAVDPTNSMAIGADMPTATDTVRVLDHNYIQIFHAEASVSDIQETENQYGISSEMAYQRAKKTVEMKKNIESRTVSDGARQEPTPANLSIPLMRGMCPFITTNVDAAGVFSQATFDTLMATIYNAGGSPKDVFCDSTRKQAISNFSGTDRRALQSPTEVINTVDTYKSDFGEVRVHYHYMLPETVAGAATDAEVLILQLDKWELAERQALQWREMARSGTAERQLGIWTISLKCLNQLASGAFKAL